MEYIFAIREVFPASYKQKAKELGEGLLARATLATCPGLALDSLSVQCYYDNELNTNPSGAGERSNPQFRTGGDGLFGLSPRAARQIRGRSGADSTVWMKEGGG